MTKEELATQLDGIEYPGEPSADLEADAKRNGLVIVFGASDDLMEFRGAISDEIGAWNGVTVQIDQEGVLEGWDDLDKHDIGEVRHWFQREGGASVIEAIWNDDENPAWTFHTDIPHATFEIMEDGEVYCRGIVFSVADLGQEPAK